MAFIQPLDKIISKNLGGDEEVGNFVEVTKGITSIVYEDKLYYPTTGTYSHEETIPGWYWDRTFSQGYGRLPINEIKTSVGGYNYNLFEGLSESDFKGAALSGLELVDVIERNNQWIPVINRGVYSQDGIDKNLYTNKSISLIASGNDDLSNYPKDNVTVAIYKRTTNFNKVIYREYKQDNPIYNYQWINDNLVVNANILEKKVGSKNLEDDYDKSFEFLGFITPDNKQSFYCKYFPLKDAGKLVVKKDNNFNVIEPTNYQVDLDLGIITLEYDVGGELYIAYEAVPRIDIELDSMANFRSPLDLKSHNWKQSNGFIEISNEDRHVSKISLSTIDDNPEVIYGTDGIRIKAQALDSRDNPIDEVQIFIKSSLSEENQELRFDGNLFEFSDETNSNGEVYCILNAPLNEESSSLFFSGKYTPSGFSVNPSNLDTPTNVQNQCLIFEVLKVDPFYGSNGISLDLEWDPDVGAYAINNNFENQDYKLFRNALENSIVKVDSGTSSFFKFIYNTGIVKYEHSNVEKKKGIEKLNKTHIWFTGRNQIGFENLVSVRLFLKNENQEGFGVERLLYQYNADDDVYEPLRPTNYRSNRITVQELDALQNQDIVSGYRLFLPKKETIEATCIDPATGRKIYSNKLKISLTLNDIYKNEIDLKDARIGIASHLSYDPATNTIYFEDAQ